ncbi:MAG: 23S rRNA (guanosine(2251)-2'-O)-methyltransferase RlmB [Actinomycetota bacterium]|nr:23S rRNA (guanosine(2251)-2'-O)-methyltransferase RlmB [Actinomycetota bacterium]
MAFLAGRNPVREAITAGRPIRRLLIAQGASGTSELVRTARDAGLRVDFVPRAKIDAKVPGIVHQGVVAEIGEFQYGDWRNGLALALEKGEVPLFLAIDGVTDPHNLGSLIRSAEAAGAHAVIVPKRRSAPVTPVVEKAAAGATAHLLVAQVTNLERTLGELKKEGVWIVALDPDAKETVFDHALLAEPVALVVGAEGPGVSRLVKERADARLMIPMMGRTSSLNAGMAGAIALFEAVRKRFS